MLGMSERQSVLFLYVISAFLGLSNLALMDYPVFSMMIYFFFSLMIVLLAVYLGKIKIVSATEVKKDFAVISTDFLYKKKILHMGVDLILMTVIYYFAYFIRFEGIIGRSNIKLFVDSLPYLLSFKMIFLYLSKVYKTESRYFSFSDGVNILKGVTLGSLATIIFLTFITRFQGYSRGVFIIDWMLTLIVLGAVKVFYRMFDEFFSSVKSKYDKGIIIVADKKVNVAIQRYLQLRPELKVTVAEHLPHIEFSFEGLLALLERIENDVSYILVQNKNLLTGRQKKELLETGILVLDEKGFFTELLKGE
jgi:UDP-GlcNAc:undecaprenyl-phosphate GlcNAc-1-phosphate transferase